MDDRDIIRNAVRALRNSDDPELGGSLHGECSDDQIAKQKAAYEAEEPQDNAPAKEEEEPKKAYKLPQSLDELMKEVEKHGPQIKKVPGGMIGMCTSLEDVMKLVEEMKKQAAYKSQEPKNGDTFTYRYDDSQRPVFYKVDQNSEVGKKLDKMVQDLKDFCSDNALPALVMVQTAQSDEVHGTSCGFEWPVIERSMGAVDLVLAMHHMVIRNSGVVDKDDLEDIAKVIAKIMDRHKDEWN